ncbi:MAG: phosphate ABC transporter substrate-binding protein PstS [Actinomycetota bacterium]
MKLYRTGLLAGVVAGAITFAACGSDNNPPGSNSAGGSNAGGSSAGSSSGSVGDCATGSLKTEGSTAQQNAITEWTKAYQQKCSGSTIAYNGTGSGAGVKNFNAGQVDFAGSDSALNAAKGEIGAAARRCASPALNLPMVTGPIAVAFQVSGVDKLTLTPSLIAKIFTGKIVAWDDAALMAANSGVNLPAKPITVFFRGDSSGTSNNFAKYLAGAAPSDFTLKPDNAWPGKTGQGKTKSQGVQQAIQTTDGSIGYIEWSYAVNGGLKYASVDNGAGPVELNADTAGKAVAAATVAGTGDDLTLKLDYATKTPGAYPIILVTYEIVCSKYSDAAIGKLVRSFLTYTAGDGQSVLSDLGYAPLPAQIQAKVQASVSKIG